MKHLYIIVEGETELAFVNQLLIPYFAQNELHTHIQGVMITIKGGGHGFNNIEHLIREIKPFLFYQNEPIITTMIDFYGINSEKKMPNYKQYMQIADKDKRIEAMEKEIQSQVQKIKSYSYFIPNLVKHEMETLFFANPDSFGIEDNQNIKNDIVQICEAYPNIEDINDTPQNAPSKRLMVIYEKYGENYQKITNGMMIAQLTGIDDMLYKSPKFKKWVDGLIRILKNT